MSEFLHLDEKYFHSVVFFVGEGEFKTRMPPNVMTNGLSTYIKSFSTKVFVPAQVRAIEHQLLSSRELGLTKQDHLRSLEQRHSSTTTCPKCGGQLVSRVAKSTGKVFTGCSNFPKCRHNV